MTEHYLTFNRTSLELKHYLAAQQREKDKQLLIAPVWN